MPSKKQARRKVEKKVDVARRSDLKKGDMVMVIAGGNSQKRPLQGQIGRIVSFSGKERDRVVVEGINMMTRHKRQSGPGKPSGRIQQEGAMHISNVMYYAEKIKKPVRLRHRFLEDGTKVRGYLDPSTKEFVQI